MKKLHNLGISLSKKEQKSITGGIYDDIVGDFCCSGAEFGTECYNNVTETQAHARVAESIVAGSCWDVTAVTCNRMFMA